MLAYIHCLKCAANIDFILSGRLKINELSQRYKRPCNKGEIVDKYVPVLSSEVVVSICTFLSQKSQLKWYHTTIYDWVNELCYDDPWISHLKQMVLPCQSPCMPKESTQ